MISSTGALSGSLLLAKGAEAMAWGDLDGDQRADVLLLQDIGMTSSTLTVHMATAF